MIKIKKAITPILISIACLASNEAISQQLKKETKPDQYRAIHRTLEDGLSSDGLNTMIKDAKGFLWVGSRRGGFCRFDGASFKKYLPDPHNRNSINSDKIISFAEDSLNNIWIGTAKGLSRYDIKADTFTNFSPYIDSLPSPWGIAPFAPNKDEIYCIEPGSLITAFNIRTLKRRKLVQVSKEVEMRMYWNTNKSFFEAGSNSIWKLSNYEGNTVIEQIFIENGKTQRYSWPCYRKNVKHNRHDAEDIRYDSKRNSIWINSGDGLLEFSLNNHQFSDTEALNGLTKSKDYERNVGIDIDVNGRIWLSTFYKGIFIYDPETESVQPVFSNPELQIKAGDANLHIYCDRDGIAWASNWMAHGIYEILPYNPPVIRFVANPKKKDALSSQEINSIIPASNGEIWIGTHDGLNILDTKTNKFRVLRQKDLQGMTGKLIAPVYIDTIRQKTLISSARSSIDFFNINLYEMDLKTRKCTPIVFRNGTKLLDTFSIPGYGLWPYKNGLLIADEKRGIFQVKENSLFADLVIPFRQYIGIGRMVLVEDRFIFLQHAGGIPNLSFENKNGKWIKISHPLDSLEWQSMFYDKKDQTYWVGFNYELVHYDKDFRKLKTYRQEDGYNGMAFNMITDNAGNLWFKNNLHQINRLDPALGLITNLSENDGYQKIIHTWFLPVAKDGKGNLYFGGGNNGITTINGGLDRINPEQYSSAATSSVYLRSLTINQKSFPLSISVNNLEELSLRHNQNTISIETGIIDYYANGKGHIRYKLKSGDNEEDWQYGPAYFTIRYEKLPPGKYELLLQASNAGQEFNSPVKILVINVSPPFWETTWFRILTIVSLLAIFFGIYRWRTATLRRQKRKLEQTVKERTAEVVAEKAEVEKQKAKSDELLLNILPSEVAEELKEKGYTTAKSFDEVTILFSDIKGFTHVAEKLNPQELVKEIDTYFSAFDKIMQQYGLEKIKTIGDAYIAAGGLPEENTATAKNVVEAAIAMQIAVEDFKKKRIENNLPYFELRIGIHTGPVVAGVVGIKKFQYDIWGDTVNLAARMEQSGVPGKINISQHTYEAVKEQFTCIHRGKIGAKNKGEIDMYFVE